MSPARLTDYERALRPITEKEFDAQVKELATTFGYIRYHTYRSERSPSGFPDLVLARKRETIIARAAVPSEPRQFEHLQLSVRCRTCDHRHNSAPVGPVAWHVRFSVRPVASDEVGYDQPKVKVPP